MADTLEEFVNATFDDDDFNSSGQANLLTTNSTTRYVIKDIQVSQADSEFSILPTLDINGFDIITLGSNGATGSEIIGTSSTLRATSSAFPLSYSDFTFSGIDTSDQVDRVQRPMINNVIDTSQGNITDYNNTAIATIYPDAAHMYAERVGPNNVVIQIRSDANSQTEFYAHDSSGTQIKSDTQSYRPKAFDGERYVYWANNNSIAKWDSWTNTQTTFPNALGSYTASSYPVCCYCGEGWLYIHGAYTSGGAGNRPFLVNVNTETFVDLSPGNNSAQSLFSHNGGGMWGVFNGDSKIYMFRNSNSSDHVKYEIDVDAGTVVDTGQNVTINISETRNWKSVWDRKLWMLDSSYNVRYYDAVLDDNQWTDSGFNLTVGRVSSQRQMVAYKATADSTEVAARTYGLNPGVKLRITGIKSEA